MNALSGNGSYKITNEMKAQLQDFYGNFATEEETKKAIRELYNSTGYVIDTHTAVAACVYAKYKRATADGTPSIIASTASPFKFTRSVMNAIDSKYSDLSDFELVDKLSELSCVSVPKAIEDIRTAPILHDHICDKTEMKQTVIDYLGL